MSIDNKIQGSVSKTFDSSYKEFRNCIASSGASVDVFTDVGVDKEVRVKGKLVTVIGECPSDIYWLSDENKDFETTAPMSGGISLNREDVEDSSAWKQTVAGQLSQEKGLTVKGTYQNKLVQVLERILIADSVGGYNGELLKAYSNGGFHLRNRRVYKNNNAQIHKIDLEVKLQEWPDTFPGFGDDAEVEFTFNVEREPKFSLEGDLTAHGFKEGQITASLEGASLSGTTLTFTPKLTTNGVDLNTTNCLVEVFDIGASDAPVKTVTDATLGSVNTVTLTKKPVGDLELRFYAYNKSKSMIIYINSTKVTNSAPATPATGSVTAGTTTGNTFPVTYTYAANDDNIAESKLAIFKTSDLGTEVNSLTPVTAGTDTAYSFTGLDASTDYTVKLMQGTKELGTATGTTKASRR